MQLRQPPELEDQWPGWDTTLCSALHSPIAASAAKGGGPTAHTKKPRCGTGMEKDAGSAAASAAHSARQRAAYVVRAASTRSSMVRSSSRLRMIPDVRWLALPPLASRPLHGGPFFFWGG